MAGDVISMTDGDGIEATLADFIGRRVIGGNAKVLPGENLIDTGRIDSLGLLQILGFVDEQWHVDLLVVGSPGDLQSVGGLAGAVRRELSARGLAAEGA